MLKEPICIKDFEDYAKAYMPKKQYDYYASGANDQQSLRESKEAFQRFRLRPRVLRDVSSIDMSTTILGQRIDFPVCVAPTGMHKFAHLDGEIGTAKAATRAGTCLVLSSWATTLLEDVARCSSGLYWFQIDVFKRLDLAATIVKRAESEGYKAIVITVDMPYIGVRYDDVRNGFALPPDLSFCNVECLLETEKAIETSKVEPATDTVDPVTAGKAEPAIAGTVDPATADTLHNPAMTWDIIHWLRTVTKLPIVIKGILTAEDAKLAVQHGVDAIMVSSHGARQLDGVPATIEVLPEIVAAVAGRIEVYVDGGVRYGTDVFKALALGARAVFVGRPVLWGLAYQGEKGAYKVLQILKKELRLAMGLCGCAAVKEIVREMVVHESYYHSKL